MRVYKPSGIEWLEVGGGGVKSQPIGKLKD